MALDLTVLITTINEEGNLVTLLPELKKHLQTVVPNHEVLIVDGHSTDRTAEVARSLGARVLTQVGNSYAAAIREGIQSARGKYLVVMDADHSHHPADVVRLFQNRLQADIVINSRYVKGGKSEAPFFRRLLSRFLNFLYRAALSLPYREVSGGFRIYRREIFERFEINSGFYDVQEELLVVPHWLGYTACEIPYTYHDRDQGTSKAKLLKYGFYLLVGIFRLRGRRKAFLAAPRPSAAQRA